MLGFIFCFPGSAGATKAGDPAGAGETEESQDGATSELTTGGADTRHECACA